MGPTSLAMEGYAANRASKKAWLVTKASMDTCGLLFLMALQQRSREEVVWVEEGECEI